MAKLLYCPLCGSAALEPYGAPAILDGKRKRRCASCGQILAPRRSRILMGGVFVLGCVATGLGLTFFVMGHKIWISALIGGPAAMVLSALAMFSRMPVYRPRQVDPRLKDPSRSC